ncbi:MAG: hypothetical protein QNK35_08765 [Bacteroides sp.]|nr:hypothetical protein [Bacteroides sp.]
MEIRKFRKVYGLELIPASHEGIFTGTLVWDPIIGSPEFSKKGMPNSIFTAFLDAELLNENEWSALSLESKTAAFLEAQLASRTVDVEVEFVNELQHPKVGKITGEFISQKLSKFTFGNIMVREMDDLIRVRIDRKLEEMKARRWKEYDGRIRRVFMITELYYGTIKMVVEKQFSAELDAQIQNSELKALARSEGPHAVEYEFSHDNVPFAMRIERIRYFNG